MWTAYRNSDGCFILCRSFIPIDLLPFKDRILVDMVTLHSVPSPIMTHLQQRLIAIEPIHLSIVLLARLGLLWLSSFYLCQDFSFVTVIPLLTNPDSFCCFLLCFAWLVPCCLTTITPSHVFHDYCWLWSNHYQERGRWFSLRPLVFLHLFWIEDFLALFCMILWLICSLFQKRMEDPVSHCRCLDFGRSFLLLLFAHGPVLVCSMSWGFLPWPRKALWVLVLFAYMSACLALHIFFVVMLLVQNALEFLVLSEFFAMLIWLLW